MINRKSASAPGRREAQALPGEDFRLQLLKGYTRTLTEMEWLVLLVAALYVLVAHREALQSSVLVVTGVFWALFSAFHYANFFHTPRQWKLAVESAMMIAFITWLVYLTGGLTTPLTSLYAIVVVTSAVTLGHRVTVLQVLAIGAGLLYVAFVLDGNLTSPGAVAVPLLTTLAWLLLAGLLTCLLADTLRASHRRLEHAAETDPLTGLFNRRLFHIVAQHEYARALRYNEPLSVFLIDVDGLKTINDAHGHATGDRVLRAVSATLSRGVRDADTVGRYGGDEFVVLLPRTDKAHALTLGRQLRRELASVRVSAGSGIVGVSVSIGVAGFPADGATLADLMEAADSAMYRHRATARQSDHTGKTSAES